MSFRDEFVGGAISRRTAIESGTNAQAADAYRRMMNALESIRFSDDHGVEELSNLLAHQDVSVRGWAATFLLPFKEDLAISSLEQIASGSGLDSFSAAMTVREWRAGRLKLPDWL